VVGGAPPARTSPPPDVAAGAVCGQLDAVRRWRLGQDLP
jgi:hypothetical protein